MYCEKTGEDGRTDPFWISNSPNGIMIKLLSYGGDFTATTCGPAIVLTSTDIGVSESSLTIPGTSLPRCPDIDEWAGSIECICTSESVCQSLYQQWNPVLSTVRHVVSWDGVCFVPERSSVVYIGYWFGLCKWYNV
jgi:hypothetical protein